LRSRSYRDSLRGYLCWRLLFLLTSRWALHLPLFCSHYHYCHCTVPSTSTPHRQHHSEIVLRPVKPQTQRHKPPLPQPSCVSTRPSQTSPSILPMGWFTATWEGKSMIRSKGKSGVYYHSKSKKDSKESSSHHHNRRHHDSRHRRIVYQEDVREGSGVPHVTPQPVSDLEEPHVRYSTHNERLLWATVLKLEESLEDAYQRNDWLENALGEAQHQLNDTQAQIQVLQDQLWHANRRHEEDIQVFRQEKEALVHQNATLRKAFRREKETLAHQNATLRKENQALKQQNEVLVALNKEFQHGRGRGTHQEAPAHTHRRRSRSFERRSQPVHRYVSQIPDRTTSPPRYSGHYRPHVVDAEFRDPKGSLSFSGHFPPSPPVSEYGI
jgi:hypothetical protein